MEFGSSAARYNQLEADIKAPSVFVVESRKRAAVEQADEDRSKKQPRQEDIAMGSSTEGAADGAVVDGQAAAAAAADPTAAYGQQPHWGAHVAPYGYGTAVRRSLFD